MKNFFTGLATLLLINACSSTLPHSFERSVASADDPDARAIKESLQRLRQKPTDVVDAAELERLKAAYGKKCFTAEAQAEDERVYQQKLSAATDAEKALIAERHIYSRVSSCVLNECDLYPSDKCRSDHVLLFRGEDESGRPPATASILHSQGDGGTYCGSGHCTMAELLAKLEKDLAEIQPIYLGKNVLLSALYAGDKIPHWTVATTELSQVATAETKPLSLREIIIALHTVGDTSLAYQDPKLGQRGLSPFISWSINPYSALVWAKKTLIVASVPADGFDVTCDERPLRPGEIVGSYFCPRLMSRSAGEQEFDAVLFLRPEYIFKVYAMAAQLF